MRKIALALLALLILPLALAAQDDANDDSFCPGAPAPRLTVGETGRVTPGLANNIRSQPASDSARVGRIPGEELFEVIGGPECADGYVWWEVRYGTLTGWTAEGTTEEYWVEPAPGGIVAGDGESATPLADIEPAAPGWQVYTSPLGFAFSYPPGWTLEETDTGVQVSGGALRLSVGVRRATQELRLIEPITVGNLETVDSVRFVGQAIQVIGLRDRGAIKAVLYATFDGSREIPAGGLIFALRLDDINPDYDRINILPELRAEGDRIVETFALGDAPAEIAPEATAEVAPEATAEATAEATEVTN